MAAAENKKKKCETIIPRDWPQLTGPAYVRGMSVEDARSLWYGFLRTQRMVHPNPRVPRPASEK